MKPKDTQIIQAQEATIVSQDEATALISQAIDKNVPVETMEKLLEMRRQLKAEKAKEAFNKAMAAFQANCPTITKTKEVKTNSGDIAYRYAPIESIVDQVKQGLNENGFSYSTNMELLPEGVKVCVKVTHEQGHSEETCMTVPLGNRTNVMSQSQVVAAAQTFAKRYAFCNAFGILTGDEDNDGNTNALAPLHTPPPAKTSLMQHNTQGGADSKPDEASSGKEITDMQKGDIIRLLGKLGKNQIELNTLVKSLYKKDSYRELTFTQAEALLDFLGKKLNEKLMTDKVQDDSEQIADDVEKGLEEK